MAITPNQVAAWIQHVTATTANICVHATDTIAVSLDITGATNPADENADTLVNDSNVVFNLTGLTAGTTYPITITVGAKTITLTLKTDPTTYDNYRIGFGSCINKFSKGDVLAQAVSRGCRKFFFLGDMGYSDTDTCRWGGLTTPGTSTTLARLKDVANRNDHKLDFLLHPEVQRITNRVACYFMHDDHDGVTNDWRGTEESVTEAISEAGGSDTAVSGDLAAIIAATMTSQSDYTLGHPANGDAGIDADAAYFRFSLGTFIEFFVIDLQPYRTTYRAADASYNAGDIRMMSTAEYDWLEARLIASTAKIKIIMSPKRFWVDSGSFNNSDGYQNYTTEHDNIISLLVNQAGWAQTGAAFICSADRHNQVVVVDDGIADFSPCPIGQTNHPNGTTAGPLLRKQFYGYGELELNQTGGYVDIRVIDVFGNIKYHGRIAETSNTLTTIYTAGDDNG